MSQLKSSLLSISPLVQLAIYLSPGAASSLKSLTLPKEWAVQLEETESDEPWWGSSYFNSGVCILQFGPLYAEAAWQPWSWGHRWGD